VWREADAAWFGAREELMIAGGVRTLRCKAGRLSYRDAADIAQEVRRGDGCATVLLDLGQTSEATTAAFAPPIVLRSDLRKLGGDLHLVHLHGQARCVYEINRMGDLLPCESESADSDL
jgi:hypothetical protein